MAEENKDLTKELRELNKHLKELKNSGKQMIYSASPFKFGLFNFIAGVFHVLGSLFGYIIIFGALAYFASKINLANIMGKWLENTLQQVKWEKIMPMPKQQDLENLDIGNLQRLQK